MTVLGVRALNRAMLARQSLLERSKWSVPEAVARLCGVQAQEPQEPFVGLWSRLSGFEVGMSDAALTGRAVVRTHLMRRTVHLVAARDALAWRSRHEAMLRQKVLGVYRSELAGLDLEEVARAGREVMSDGCARTMRELAEALEGRWPAVSRRALGELVVAALVPMAQLPPRGLWKVRAGVRNLPLQTWLGCEVDPPAERGDPVGRELVRRYLAAFGPATTADVRAWCGLAGLPAAVRELEPELVSFRDEWGRRLWDLEQAPRPDPDTPAPVRFLPAFDNAILGYRDRSRVIDEAHLGLSVAGQRAVLVDGRAAATWTYGRGWLEVAPLRPLSRAECEGVEAEGWMLAGFLEEGVERVRILKAG
ncbi:winged helix DNA-binding domain-containing protein [Nocardiopsis alba]|uniref:winged helix DNA-binding domain-containing protein n=1 Tax=Nocardiopsis alba TaxID=53437 RepID=UPI0033BA5428